MNGPIREQEPLFAKAYLRLGEPGQAQEVYQLAAAFFQARGRPADGPAADYARLLEALDKPSEKYATQFSGDDQAAWSIVQGRARLLLLLTLYRAGEYVQARWNESIVQPLKAVPASEQVATLYGEQGKLNAFVNDWLKPFVTEKERAPVKVAGIAMPLAPAFRSVVGAERQYLPVLGADKPFLAGSFVFAGPSEAGQLYEGPEGTVLEVDCKERLFRAASNARSLAEAKTSVFWSPVSCVEARIRIDLEEPLPDAMPAAAPAAAVARRRGCLLLPLPLPLPLPRRRRSPAKASA